MMRVVVVSLAWLLPVLGYPQAPVGEALEVARCGGRESRNESLTELMEEYWQWKLTSYPEWATLSGFPGYNHLVEDFSLEGILGRGERCGEFLERSCLLEEEVEEGGQEARYKVILDIEVGDWIIL